MTHCRHVHGRGDHGHGHGDHDCVSETLSGLCVSLSDWRVSCCAVSECGSQSALYGGCVSVPHDCEVPHGCEFVDAGLREPADRTTLCSNRTMLAYLSMQDSIVREPAA